MASFTDETPQFTPYVSQIDTNAALQVGLQKQSQYNEGVQKIQSQIDTVAGIELSRDVDKQYLQGKLDVLAKDLKVVSVGDFSNFQLVNSVGGMVNRIAKDGKIQTAYASTQNDKKQLAKISKDKEDGKGNPANDYYYQKQRESWLNNPEAGAAFNGEYVPYFDVFKNAKEMFDEVKPDGYSFDQIYVTDSSGKPVMQNGKPVYSPHMASLEKEGVFPPKVAATLDQIFSDPRVDTQLSISGGYNFRGYSPEFLAESVKQQGSNLVSSLNERLNSLQLDINSGKNVQDEIDQVKLQIDNVKAKYADYEESVLQNPDAVRAALYKDQVKSNYSTMFGWSKTKESIKSNPAWDAVFKMNQEANRVSRFEQRLKFDMNKDAFDRQHKIATLAMKQKELEDKFGGPTLLQQDFQGTDDMSYVEQFDKTIEVAGERYKTATDELVYRMVLDSPETAVKFEEYKRAGNSNAEASAFIIKDKVEENFIVKNKRKPSPVELEAAINEQKTTWQTEAISKLEKVDPNTMSTKNRLLKESFIQAKQEFDNVNVLQDQYEKTMGPEALGILNSEKAKALSKGSVIEVEGTPVSVSAQDMVDAAIVTKSRGIFSTRESQALADQARNRLAANGKDFLLTYVNALQSSQSGRGEGWHPDLGKFKSQGFNENFSKVLSAMDDEETQKAIKTKADVLKQLNYSVSPNLKGSILTGKAETDRDTRQNLARIIGNYQTNKQNLDPNFKNKANDMLNTLKKNENIGIELKTTKNDVTGEVTPRIVMYDANGKVEGSLIVSDEEALELGKINVNNIYQPKKVTLIQNRINFNPNNRTSIGNPESKETYSNGSSDYLYSTSDFKNLNGVDNVQVKANIGTMNGRYIPYIYVYDGQTEKVVDLGDYSSLSEVISKLEDVNSSLVNSILKEK